MQPLASTRPVPAAGSDAVKASNTTALPAGICCGWSRVTRTPGLSHWSPTSGREADAFFTPGSQMRTVMLWTPRDSHTLSGLPGISHCYRGRPGVLDELALLSRPVPTWACPLQLWESGPDPQRPGVSCL